MSQEDYRIEYIDLPVRVKGLVALDDDGFPTILINARLSHDVQLATINHELEHIEHDDMYSDDDIRAVERRVG